MASKLYVDLTTAFEEVGRHPHGTLRVERGLVAALAEIGRADIAFCRHVRARGGYAAVAPSEALAVARAPTIAESRREVRPKWRDHPILLELRRAEAWVRRRLRDPIRRRVATAARNVAAPLPLFEPGSTVLFPGELQRHDFALLLRLREELGLQYVFLFYDLLGVLPADDPRRHDPHATDLPGTDFITRTGSLILAISRFSADALTGYWQSHAMAGPPVKVIRLAGAASADVAAPKPVLGLEPGNFVLTVGDLVPRKNHELLLSAWAELLGRGVSLPKLVIAGRVAGGGASIAKAIAENAQLSRHARILANADDGELAWLYANCRFTAFPSLSEGFGLPVAESLSAGKLCIASDATAIPEASQGLAIHLDPRDRAAWLTAIERLAHADAELAAYEQAIRTRYRRVAWRDTAQDVLSAIASLPEA